jgi:hypothetical protein
MFCNHGRDAATFFEPVGDFLGIVQPLVISPIARTQRKSI